MSGIVRRIDDLGRIVIPKEIRRGLKIKEGESIDIDVLEDKIILKRYSNFLDIENYLNILVDFLGNSIKKDILIFDNTKIVTLHRENFDNVQDELLSDDILDLLQSRRENYEYMGTIAIKEKKYNGSFIFSSIIPNGDVIGGILIYSKDSVFTEKDYFSMNLLRKTLKKYIEE